MNNEIRQGQAWIERAISDVFVGIEFERWYEKIDNGTYILRGGLEGEKNLKFIASMELLEDIPNTKDLRERTPSLIQKYFKTWRLNPDKKHKFEIFEKFLK